MAGSSTRAGTTLIATTCRTWDCGRSTRTARTPRAVFKNYTRAPHCTFEAKPIPGSSKIIFTASAHHAQTMGSLVLLDPSAGTDGAPPMTRLTPGGAVSRKSKAGP